MAAYGRGCVKTQNRPLEIVSKLGEFSVEVSCLLTGRYRLVSQSIASHVVLKATSGVRLLWAFDAASARSGQSTNWDLGTAQSVRRLYGGIELVLRRI